MSDTSRRNFLAAAGVGAAVTTTVLGTTSAAQAAPSGPRATEPVVAVVEPRGSVVRLLVGEREVVVRDRDLATRILAAAGGE